MPKKTEKKTEKKTPKKTEKKFASLGSKTSKSISDRRKAEKALLESM